MFVDGVGNGQDLNFYTPSGSVPAQADAGGSPVSVVSVGATDAQVDINLHQPATVIEPFSSQEPTEATPQAAACMKPRDGNRWRFGYGSGRIRLRKHIRLVTLPCEQPISARMLFLWQFCGIAHAAAIAALVLQAAPCLLSSSTVNTPAAGRSHLRDLLTGTATPLPGISQAVPNNIEGFPSVPTFVRQV